MITLSQDNIVSYLREIGQLPPQRPGVPEPRVTSLGGGVSNIVLRVTDGDIDMVIKQALPRLNVAEEWLASIDRVGIEVECLKLFERGLPPGAVPKLLYYDADNYSYGMTMLPEQFRMWKSELLEGRVREEIARSVGDLLGQIHGMTWDRAQIGPTFDDVKPFTQLRIDAYYRTTQSRHPEDAVYFDRAIDLALNQKETLVHGDFSPKNILVDEAGQVVLLDYEVAHFGDPAFDLGFLLNHLVLKAVHVPRARTQLQEAAMAFWDAYQNGFAKKGVTPSTDLEERVVAHLGCLQLARIDGKSPAEYIQDEREKETVRRFAKGLLRDGVRKLGDVIDRLSNVREVG